MNSPLTYINSYPMSPLAGLIVLPVGLCIVAGGFLQRRRWTLLIAGFALGVLTMLFLGARFAVGVRAALNHPALGPLIGTSALPGSGNAWSVWRFESVTIQ